MEGQAANANEYINLVLPFGTSEEEMASFAKTHGFSLVHRSPEDKDRRALLTVTYRHHSLNAIVQYVFNYLIHIVTARCFGSDQLKAADMLRSFFFVVDEQEIRERLSSDGPGDRGLAMAYLAEFAPATFEPGIMDLFEKGTGDTDKDVREFAFLAMGMAGWPELLPLAQRALTIEKDSYLRGQLERLVNNLKAARAGV